MANSTLVPTSNYHYGNDSDSDTTDDEEDGQVLNYDSEEEHEMMRYDAQNSFMYPFSKKDSKFYDKEWTEWRQGKPTHSKEWPSSMMFGEQLTSEETYSGAKAATQDEFWGNEDPWDSYADYQGTAYEHLPDTLMDRLQQQKSQAHGKNVYDYDRGGSSVRGETEADLAEGALYVRNDDVMITTGRERFVRLTEKITPTVYNQAPRSNRETEGRPVIEYMRMPMQLRDQVVRDDLPDGAPTAAPPVMPDMDYPSIRETKFGWKSDFGALSGGYEGEGETLVNNDVSQGMINRAQMKLPPMMGPPSSQVPGVGDSIAVNEVGGERMGFRDVSMSQWGDAPGAPSASSGWLTRVNDISSDGRMRHADGFISLWGDLPGPQNASAGWKTRVDDIVADGRMGHPSKFLSLWGSVPANQNSTSGWKTRADDVIKDGRVGHAGEFLNMWGGGPSNPSATAGWKTRPDDIKADGRMRADAPFSLWGSNPGALEGKGTSLALNNVFNGARTSERGTLIPSEFLLPGAPEGSFGGLNVNMRVHESTGRRPETMEVTGNRGGELGQHDGVFSVGDLYGQIRSNWSRFGAIGGGMEGIYIQDMFNLTNTTTGKRFRSTEPDCSLMQQVMKGLGSKTICGMGDPQAFDDLSPFLAW